MAIPRGNNVRVFGLCEKDEKHDAHIFPTGVVDMQKNKLMHSCPGQYSDCRNCDDRKCMGCVFREYDHDCKDDCPMCCPTIGDIFA